MNCMRRKTPVRSLGLLGLLGVAAVAVASPPSAAPPATADALLDQFRAGWHAETEHMRPLDDDSWKIRMEVLHGLAKRGGEAVPSLIAALDDEDAEVRVLAAQALAYLADPRAKARLEQTLADDPDPAARLYAVDALGAIGDLEPSPLLKRIESDDPNRDVQAHVRFALERQGNAIDPSIREQLANFDPKHIDTARIDEPAPDFELTDALGATYRLSDFQGKSAVVLVFIYGDT